MGTIDTGIDLPIAFSPYMPRLPESSCENQVKPCGVAATLKTAVQSKRENSSLSLVLLLSASTLCACFLYLN